MSQVGASHNLSSLMVGHKYRILKAKNQITESLFCFNICPNGNWVFHICGTCMWRSGGFMDDFFQHLFRSYQRQASQNLREEH